MTEDRFEEFLRTAAKGYNAPPPQVPREEMWAGIRSARATGPRLVYGAGEAEPHADRHPLRSRRLWLGAAAAAVMLVATGVGVGRWSADGGSSSPARTVAARNPAPARVVAPDSLRVLKTAEPDGAAPSLVAEAPNDVATSGGGKVARGTSAPRRIDAGSPPQVATGSRGGSVLRGGADASALALVAGNAIAPPNQPASAYQLVALRHLSNAEALLTSFRSRSEADAQLDAQLARWARDLLSSTRLLLDSPVANDQQRRPLLEDLELVLVQIVQLSPATATEDRKAIENTIQQENVLTRLRTAIPAGQRGT